MTGRRMADSRRTALVAIAAIAAGAAGVAAHRLFRSDPAAPDVRPKNLRQLSLPDLAGKPQSLTQWRDRVLLVNFWATWCEPCREEVPALVKMQSAFGGKGLQIVGISVDSVDKVVDFSLKFKINYPLLIAGYEVIELLRELGNKVGSLPYTVILGRNGGVITSHLGGLTEAELEKLLLKALG